MYYYRPKQHKGVAAFTPGQHNSQPPRRANPRGGKKRTARSFSGLRRRFTAVVSALLVFAMLAGLLYILPSGAFGSYDKSEFAALASLPGGYTHILLIGADVDSNGTSRSDTMMIMSVGRGNIYLTSLQRDTGVYMEGRNGLIRLNAAYQYGGVDGLIRTINQNFGLDITRYALVDYDSCPRILDLIGGVDIAGITDDEANQINRNMREIIGNRYKAGKLTYEQASALYASEYIPAGGDLHLDGMQALGYARIRKLDSDYGRTNRQRKLIKAAIASFKRSVLNPITFIQLVLNGPGTVKTNIGMLELISLGEKAMLGSVAGQMRLPVDGTYKDDGGMFYNVDYTANHNAFINFVYNY